jgi:ubiquinone biosynthesis protein Coq4
MKEQGYDPEKLYSYIKITSDASYVEARLNQTHDIWHIVTGFDTSPVGEIGLQAFHLAQFPYPLATMLISNGLMSSTLLAPEELPKLLRVITIGWRMGSKAKSLFAQKWEDGWRKTLTQWRSDLNIVLISS